MDDVAPRLSSRALLTADGYSAYLDAVTGVFGNKIDFATLIKLYGKTPDAEKRYSPPTCVGARTERNSK